MQLSIICGITMVRLVSNSGGETLEFSDSEFLEVEREKSYLSIKL